LAGRFLVPPFSVFDARQGYWQDRKRAWLALGIRSEVGRGGPGAYPTTGSAAGVAASLHAASERRLTWVTDSRDTDRLDDTSRKILAAQPESGASIFDPVLCELIYRWFSPPGGSILDPFAGGSVRGIVAGRLGYTYTGIDLRPEQIAANEEQASLVGDGPRPRWLVGDSIDVATLAPGRYDLVFSCPPYADLERYSDDPRDLSTLEYPDFISAYRKIIAASLGLLKPNRFAAFVVGDVRDRRGYYRAFPADTVRAFEDAGARLYNDVVLVTMVGSLSLRVARQFSAGRKIGKTHQNVLIFYKGDTSAIRSELGEVEVES
jgi:hypothetical protein